MFEEFENTEMLRIRSKCPACLLLGNLAAEAARFFIDLTVQNNVSVLR